MFGWGAAATVEPGSGADRFDRSLRRLRASGAPIAMASFTFDENDSGSVVVVPSALMRIDDGAARARMPVLLPALRLLGVTVEGLDDLAATPVLGGGKQVGAVQALLPHTS